MERHLQNIQIVNSFIKVIYVHTYTASYALSNIHTKCTDLPQGYSITPSEIAMYIILLYCIQIISYVSVHALKT